MQPITIKRKKPTVPTLSKSSSRLWLATLVSALSLLGLTAQAQSTITNGLVAYWNFDAKNFKDSVGKFNGTENPDQLKPIVFVEIVEDRIR